MRKLYYSSGEVADILGESVTLVRFWANSFSRFIRPGRNARGNRLFTAGDVEMFKRIHYLVKVRRMTLEGAAGRLRDEGRKVAAEVRVIESLKEIRARLADVRKSMDTIYYMGESPKKNVSSDSIEEQTKVCDGLPERS